MSLTADQRSYALARSRAVRLRRTELLGPVMGSSLAPERAVEILEAELDEAIENVRIFDFLRRIPSYGRDRIRRRLLVPMRVSEQRPLGMLTVRQRREIADRLRRYM